MFDRDVPQRKRKGKNIVCPECGKETYRKPCEIAKGYMFCSIKCGAIYRRKRERGIVPRIVVPEYRENKYKEFVCSQCNSAKPHKAKGLCLSCYRVQLYKDHPEKQRTYSREYYRSLTPNGKKHVYEGHQSQNRRLRKEVLNAYGGKCACCGENASEFLAIDHVNGGGGKHRKEVGGAGGSHFYAWLKHQGFPQDEFRLLCHNCNFSRGKYGYCPHELTLSVIN